MIHIATFFVVLFSCQQNVYSCPSSPSEEATTKTPETHKTSEIIEPSKKPKPSEIPKPPETSEPPKTTIPSETQKSPDTLTPSGTPKPQGTSQPPKTSKTFGTEKPVAPLVKKYIMVATGASDLEPGTLNFKLNILVFLLISDFFPGGNILKWRGIFINFQNSHYWLPMKQ